MKLIQSTPLRRLLPATLLAAAFTLGGNAFGHSATACAAPDNEYNEAGYQVCSEGADEGLAAGTITVEKWKELLAWCCQEHGGRNVGTGICIAPAVQPVPGAVEQPTDAATETPPSPRLPVAPQPSDIATRTPQPAAPPTTSTFPPPPLR